MARHARSRNAVRQGPSAGGVEHLLARAALHGAAGRTAEAERKYRRVLEARPDHPVAHYELGALASRAGQSDEAVSHLTAALWSSPEQPGYWLALTTALLAAERLADARALLERFMARGFEGGETRTLLAGLATRLFAEAHHHYQRGEFRRAEPLLDAVILIDDTHAEATHLAGNIAAQTNRLERAVDLLSIAILRDPTNAAYFANLGTTLSRQRLYPGAMAALEKALELDPTQAMTHSNLGVVYQKQERLQEALHHLDQALDLEPGLARAHSNRGVVLKDLGRVAEAITAFDRALVLDPTMDFVHSNRLFAKLYAADVPPQDYHADAVAFGRRYADPLLRRRPFRNDRDPERRLRVGFVSGDLREHAVAFYFEPFLQHLDPERFETFAYMTAEVEDARSESLKATFAHWRSLAGLNDDEAADRIEADRIDVLVDLSGHSAGHRLLVLARKPAPVQATWLGHPATTGLAAIDYRLTDAVMDPPGLADALHVEEVWRLETASACYRPMASAPAPRAHAPFEDNGVVTFGCTNRFTKVSDAALATWARILAASPGARLLFVVADIEAPEVRAATQARLAANGLPLDRVVLMPRVATGHYHLYHQIDVALDPFPYNGGTTSLDTLYMGVPFVALEGTHTVSRVGMSILLAAGLDELVARTPDAYVDLAANLAADPDRIRRLRHGLRERVEAGPHMNHRAVAEEIGEAFRTMWRRWLSASAG